MLIQNNFWKSFGKKYKRKEWIADAYRFDKIDADSCFFYNFWDVFTQNNRIIRLSKGFEYATFSIKKIWVWRLHYKTAFRFVAKLHIKKYETLFTLNSIPEIMEQHRNLSQSSYTPIPEQVTINSSLQGALFFHIYKNYNAEG